VFFTQILFKSLIIFYFYIFIGNPFLSQLDGNVVPPDFGHAFIMKLIIKNVKFQLNLLKTIQFFMFFNRCAEKSPKAAGLKHPQENSNPAELAPECSSSTSGVDSSNLSSLLQNLGNLPRIMRF